MAVHAHFLGGEVHARDEEVCRPRQGGRTGPQRKKNTRGKPPRTPRKRHRAVRARRRQKPAGKKNRGKTTEDTEKADTSVSVAPRHGSEQREHEDGYLVVRAVLVGEDDDGKEKKEEGDDDDGDNQDGNTAPQKRPC